MKTKLIHTIEQPIGIRVDSIEPEGKATMLRPGNEPTTCKGTGTEKMISEKDSKRDR